MNKDTKYIPSGGLLLAEEGDMKKLSNLAREGWILESFERLSFKLRKDEPQEIEYCIDYNEEKNDLEEYLSMFENSEWEYICSYDKYHFFKAPKGSTSIYTDKETLSSKYEKQYKIMQKSLVGLIYLIVACILGFILLSIISNSSITIRGLKMVLSISAGVGIGILIPFILCTIIARKKVEI